MSDFRVTSKKKLEPAAFLGEEYIICLARHGSHGTEPASGAHPHSIRPPERRGWPLNGPGVAERECAIDSDYDVF